MSLDSTFMAAKYYQNAATIYSANLGRPDKARSLYQQAARYYQAHGSADKAAELLEKAARDLESLDPNGAIELQMEACDVYEEENRPRFAVETLHRTVHLLIRQSQLSKASEMMQKLANNHRRLDQLNGFNKDCLSLVIIALAAGDEVAASKHISEASNQSMQFSNSDECHLAQALIESFQQQDADALEQQKKKQTLLLLGNEVIKLAQSLSLSLPATKTSGVNRLPTATKPANSAEKLAAPEPVSNADELGIC